MVSYSVETVLKYCRVVTVILAFVVLVVGLNSHYRSSWVSIQPSSASESDLQTAAKLHELCEIKYFYGNCPAIILEQFFVAVITINFIFSLLGVVTYYLWYRKAVEFHPLKWLDLGYHAVSASFLLAAAVVYLLSAFQIKDFSGGVDSPAMNFRTEEKIVAGILTIVQTTLHFSVAVLISKCKRPATEIPALPLDFSTFNNNG